MVKSNKKDYGKFGIYIIIGLAIMYFLIDQGYIGNIGIGGKTSVGDDFPAFVDESTGECIGREGIEMGLCCGTWDPIEKKTVWVLCDTLIEQSTTQAFFTFEGGTTLSAIAEVMFSVGVTSDIGNNANAGVRISQVSAINTIAGDAISATEIEDAFAGLVSLTFQTLAPGASYNWNMGCDYRIRIDVPETYDDTICLRTINAFQVTDGTYEVILSIEIEDEQGFITSGGSRTVQLIVEQERLSFSIDISTL